MKCALFAYTSPSLKGIAVVRDERYSEMTDMVRTSEYVDVDFPPRALEEIVPEQVANIDKEIAEVTAKFAKALDGLKTQKANLLALTDQRVAA